MLLCAAALAVGAHAQPASRAADQPPVCPVSPTAMSRCRRSWIRSGSSGPTSSRPTSPIPTTIGRWEQSDTHGYMSTNGACTNQYHIRMWSSRALHDETHAHLLEVVLTPIHHDHSKPSLCSKPPFAYRHGKPDLSYEEARDVYAHLMYASGLCAFGHRKMNPESENHRYAGYVSDGWVSRISFSPTRKRGCSGA